MLVLIVNCPLSTAEGPDFVGGQLFLSFRDAIGIVFQKAATNAGSFVFSFVSKIAAGFLDQDQPLWL
jgi:hypothetical protein